MDFGSFANQPIVDSSGRPSMEFLLWLQEVHTKVAPTLNLQSQLVSTTKVSGRTEGIGTTVQHLDSAGIVTAPGVDFSRSYTNKQLDNIPDGPTYGRPLNTALTANQVDLSKNGVIGPLGSAKVNKNVMFNFSNNATVDSVDNGTNATIRVYGSAGGVGSTWHQLIGSVAGAENPAFSGAYAYDTTYWVYLVGSSYFVTTTQSDTLADGVIFAGSLHTVASGGSGGTIGGGGTGGGNGGRGTQ